MYASYVLEWGWCLSIHVPSTLEKISTALPCYDNVTAQCIFEPEYRPINCILLLFMKHTKRPVEPKSWRAAKGSYATYQSRSLLGQFAKRV